MYEPEEIGVVEPELDLAGDTTIHHIHHTEPREPRVGVKVARTSTSLNFEASVSDAGSPDEAIETLLKTLKRLVAEVPEIVEQWETSD